MVGRRGHCFVFGCTSGTDRDRKQRKLTGEKNLSLFSPPRDPELFEKWKTQIPGGKRALMKTDRICELHFSEREIERYYITKLPDGSVSKIERGKISLTHGVVPHIFNLAISKEEAKDTFASNSPNDIVKIVKENSVNLDEQNEIIEMHENIKKKYKLTYASIKSCLPKESTNMSFSVNSNNRIENVKNENSMSHDGKTEIIDISQVRDENTSGKCKITYASVKSCLSKEAASYMSVCNSLDDIVKKVVNENSINCDKRTETMDILQAKDRHIERNCNKAVASIKVPNQWWGINSTPEFMICVKWDVTYFPELKVIIENDLKVKVFIKDREINVNGHLNVNEKLKLSSIKDISHLLLELDRYRICAGVDDKSMKNCLGHIEQNSRYGRFTPWCKSCREQRRKLHCHKKNCLLNKEKHKKIRNLVSIIKKKSHLKQKIVKSRNGVMCLRVRYAAANTKKLS